MNFIQIFFGGITSHIFFKSVNNKNRSLNLRLAQVQPHDITKLYSEKKLR